MDTQNEELVLGVGDGIGNLFVKGDYDSITTLQATLLERNGIPKSKANMNFSQALSLIKLNERVRRDSWPKDHFIFRVQGSTFKVNRPPLNEIFTEGTEVNYDPHIDICTGFGHVGVWTPTQEDIFAEDFEVVVT
jgi:hypothetical protein